ncbi:MAG: decaprenyl-phosphate phosphoribosyltransferase [Myxococcaceae bacterium]
MSNAAPELHSVAPPSDPVPPASSAKGPSLPRAILKQLRPRQWTKNAAVLAPLLFAKAFLVPGKTLRAILAAIAFSFVASGIYILNDWLDREKDRLHPEKKLRPIAAGIIGGPLAAAMLATLWAGGFSLAWWVRPAFAGVLAGYVAMQIAYSTYLKHLVILDVLLIAVGFVLRVIAGGVAISEPTTNWLYLCTLLLALFLGFAKRRHELSSLQGDAGAHRANLSEYSLPMLDQFIAVTSASCILAYGLYTVSAETVKHVGSDDLKFTVPFVIYGFFRYLFLMHRRNMGGSPEKVLLSDPPLIICLVLFVGVAAVVLYRGAAGL